MRILHITDTHIKRKDKKGKQDEIVESLIDSIRKLDDIDLVIFSGDLTNRGLEEEFTLVEHKIINPILESLNLDKKSIFFCQGNHDVTRDREMKAVTSLFRSDISNNEELNSFVLGNSEDFKVSLRPSENYFNWVSSFYPSEEFVQDEFSELRTVHKREIKGKTIGIATINSAWRAINDEEKTLLFPLETINECSNLISDCDLKLIVHHHPTKYYINWNEYEIEDLISTKFDISFFGHIHKESTSIDFNPAGGMIKVCSAAGFGEDSQTKFGYNIVELDFDELSFKISPYIFHEAQGDFVKSEETNGEIPSSTSKKKKNKFRKTLRKRFDSELLDAEDLFVAKIKLSNNQNFLQFVTQPVLRDKPKGNVNDSILDLNWDTLPSSGKSYLFIGQGKCGKSTLLKKIQLDLLRNYNEGDVIPFYLNFEEIRHIAGSYDLRRRIRDYFELTNEDLEVILKEGQLLLLLDNFSIRQGEIIEKVSNFLMDYPDSSVFACAEQTNELINSPLSIGPLKFKKVFFHELKKTQIRNLAENWPGLSVDQREEVVEKIEKLFKQFCMPYNFWTVSLFLWICKKQDNNSFQNDVDLLNLYIESLLERENLIKTKSVFGYQKYVDLLSFLAYRLLKDHAKTAYRASLSEIIKLIEEHLAKNLRSSITESEVWDYICSKGLMKEYPDGKFTFRLNGVFEYFLAKYMQKDESFRNEMMADDNVYLQFKNEFELYAGFTKTDRDFLSKIYEKTKEIFSALEAKYDLSKGIDNLIDSKMSEAKKSLEKIQHFSESVKSVGLEEKDKLHEELSKELGIENNHIHDQIKIKSPSILNKESIDDLEKSISILGRVYRNCDNIEDTGLEKEVFNYVIDTTSLLGALMLDDAKEKDLEKLEKEEVIEKHILKVINYVTPLIVQFHIAENIGHRNLEGLVQAAIDKIKEDGSVNTNQFRLFNLIFLLVDVDINQYKSLISEALNLITLPVLRYCVVQKIKYYIMFKSYENENLAQFLKDELHRGNKLFEGESDTGKISQATASAKGKSLGYKR